MPITIYGDGESSRDYTFIDDIVNGIIASLDYKGENYEIFNLGNSKTILLRNLIELVQEVVGKRAIIKFEKEKPGDVLKTFADISKARSSLNYFPRTPISEGLKEFNNWFRKHYKID